MSLISPTAVSDDAGDTALPALLAAFYERVRSDALFRPWFDQGGEDWLAQVRRLGDLWSSMMLNGFRGQSIPTLPHPKDGPAITAAMFERWLNLWREVTAAMLPPDAAAAMQVRARRVSISLQRALGLWICEA